MDNCASFGRGIEDYGIEVLAELSEFVPFLGEEGGIEYVTCGYYELTPDDKAILGEDARALRSREVWKWFGGDGDAAATLSQTLASGTSIKGAETVITREDGTMVPIGISCSSNRAMRMSPCELQPALGQSWTRRTVIPRSSVHSVHQPRLSTSRSSI